LPSLTKTIIIAGSGALTAVVLLAGLAVAPQSATALPTYAQKEHKDCESCHVNPAGDGVRNASASNTKRMATLSKNNEIARD
jgi:hypothetical protein